MNAMNIGPKCAAPHCASQAGVIRWPGSTQGARHACLRRVADHFALHCMRLLRRSCILSSVTVPIHQEVSRKLWHGAGEQGWMLVIDPVSHAESYVSPDGLSHSTLEDALQTSAPQF